MAGSAPPHTHTHTRPTPTAPPCPRPTHAHPLSARRTAAGPLAAAPARADQRMRAPQPTPPLPSVSGAACSALGARGTRLRCSGQERAAPTCGAREQRRACSSEADGSQAGPAPQRVGGTPLKGTVLAARVPGSPPPLRERPAAARPMLRSDRRHGAGQPPRADKGPDHRNVNIYT